VNNVNAICLNCKRPYPDEGTPYKCPKCGGLFDISGPLVFDPAQVDASQPGIWRYRHTFGLPNSVPAVSLGEGSTPLVWDKAFGRKLAFKSEYSNPTGSFKDRGTAPLVAFLRSRDVNAAVEDSSGNAGASFAAYAAHAGMKATVYVPAAASGPKRAQIASYGATLHPVPGSRSDVSEAVKQAADTGLAYASHAYLPFNIPGYATTAYEIHEQLGGAPSAVITPAGQGGLFLGLQRGFDALQRAGLIASVPRIIGVQARACCPLWVIATVGAAGLGFVTEGQTLAEGVRVRFPLRAGEIRQVVEAGSGSFVAVDEADILRGRDELANRGLYVEPTSAIVWSALEQTLENLADPVVVMLTGSGYKSEVL
jgi:threonine synthase